MCKRVYGSHFFSVSVHVTVLILKTMSNLFYVQNRKLGNMLRLINVTLFGYFEEKASWHVRMCHLSDKKSKVHLNKEMFDLLMRKAFLEHAVVELVYEFNEKSTVSV